MKLAVSAVLLAKNTGRVALIRRANEPRKGQWSLPGGSVEQNESLEDALARELREELGVDFRSIGNARVVARVRLDEKGHDYEITVFLCETRDEPALTLDSDASDASWTQPSECRARGLAEDTARIVEDACAMSNSNS